MTITPYCPPCGTAVTDRGVNVTRRRPPLGFSLTHLPGLAIVDLYRYHPDCWRLEFDFGPASLRAFQERRQP